ncbi:MAG: CvpA family protein [Lachnospiraceae bacterium]
MVIDGFAILIYVIGIVCILRGFLRGMMKMIISVVGVVLTILLVSVLAPKMENILLEYEPLYEKVQETSQEYLLDMLPENGTPDLEEQERLIENLPLPKSVREEIKSQNHAGSYSEMLVNTFAEYLSRSITCFLIKILAYVVVFILVNLVIQILSAMILKIFRMPGLHMLNAMGGGVLGAIQGLIVIWLIFLAVTLCYGTDWGSACYEVIQRNEIFRYLYDKNLFLYLLRGV